MSRCDKADHCSAGAPDTDASREEPGFVLHTSEWWALAYWWRIDRVKPYLLICPPFEGAFEFHHLSSMCLPSDMAGKASAAMAPRSWIWARPDHNTQDIVQQTGHGRKRTPARDGCARLRRFIRSCVCSELYSAMDMVKDNRTSAPSITWHPFSRSLFTISYTPLYFTWDVLSSGTVPGDYTVARLSIPYGGVINTVHQCDDCMNNAG